jgi:release factor glutamine methyltransferase
VIRVSDELASACSALACAGRSSPRVDAELLLRHVLGVSRVELLIRRTLDQADVDSYRELVRQRAEGIPLQHLTGRAPYRGLDLAVGPGVFIPRPETELVIDIAAERLARADVVVDLCSGSGAIALAVAQEYSSCEVVAVELSGSALAWLRLNAAAREAAGDRPIRVEQADVSSSETLAELTGKVDVVLANPPYVPDRMREEIQLEVSHDPGEAVFAGHDGLAVIAGVVRAAVRLLRPGGLLVLEHDDSHCRQVGAMLSARDWSDVTARRDLPGAWRFTSALRS